MPYLIWNSLEQWFLRDFKINAKMDIQSILLGNPNNEPFIDALIIITKHEIYKRRWKNKNLNFIYLKLFFKLHMKTEICLGTGKNILAEVLDEWALVHNNVNLL